MEGETEELTAAWARSVAKQKELTELLDSCGREGKKVLADNHRLRELNAELVMALEFILAGYSADAKALAYKVIAKAEALK